MTLDPIPTDRPVLTWYGDDFTGSGAVLEVLRLVGLPSVLFLDPPTPESLARFPGVRAVGVAGDARTRSPDWMRAELPRHFAALRALGAPILHYKICSTLDSGPAVGSIGAAAEVALAGEPPDAIALLVVASPDIGRWQAFGTLFARAGTRDIHRLDRHPTMAHHPVTPMDEADVGRHLARQTMLPVGLVNLIDLKEGRGPARLAQERARGTRILALDVVDEETLAAAGELVWQAKGFVIGSQGIENALIAAWRRAGMLPQPGADAPLEAVDRIAIVSGSCSPVTAAQIDAAEAAGFAVVPLDPRAPDWEAATAAALDALAQGRSPLVASARGNSGEGADPDLGTGLGRLLDRLIRASGLKRVMIAGGDTSSQGARALGLMALTPETAIAPGAPLLRGHYPDGRSIEIVLKGGQMGAPDFFLRTRDGLLERKGNARRDGRGMRETAPA